MNIFSYLKDKSIRYKIIFINMITCLVILLIWGAVSLVLDLIDVRNTIVKQTSSIADTIAKNMTAALDFDDDLQAGITLQTLQVVPNIQVAYVFNTDAKLFAQYNQDTNETYSEIPPNVQTYVNELLLDSFKTGSHFLDWNELHVLRPVRLQNQTKGVLYIRSDIDEYYLRFVWFAGTFSLLFISLLAFAYFISDQLQKSISMPLEMLLHTTSNITKNDDYSLRVPKVSHDEIGEVIDGVNNMLVHIQIQDVELKQHKDELEYKVKKSIEEIQQTNAELELTVYALQQAKDGAVAANRAKSQFLANMSHEIRTPLNGLLGMMQLMSNSTLTESQIKLVETANSSGRALLSLINDILDFSKIEAGKMELHIEELSLQGLVEDTVNMFREQTKNKGIHLDTMIDLDIPNQLLGDATRVKQILINLISNAVKFTSQGSITIHVKFEDQLENGILVLFNVIDTGVGISQGEKMQVFDSFYQADATTTRKFGGTGLGLAISSQLAQLIGGNIGVESQVGKGSTFWFTIAFELPSLLNQQKLAASLNQVRVQLNCTNTTIINTFKTYLAQWEVSCDFTDSLETTYQLIDQTNKNNAPYHLIFLDTRFTNDELHSVVHLIHQNTKREQTYIYLITDEEEASTLEPKIKDQVSGILTIPVRISRIYHIIANAARITADKNRTPSSTSKNIAFRQLNSTVLIVEDNEINQDVSSTMLQHFGCNSDIASNGLEAVSMFNPGIHQLIFMDCQMPEMDGYEATRVLRKQEEKRLELHPNSHRTPIIAMTAHAQPSDRKKCLEAGMDDYMTKPFTLEELYEKIVQWIVHFPSSDSSYKNRKTEQSITLSTLPNVDTPSIDQSYIEKILQLQGTSNPKLLVMILEKYLQKIPALLDIIQNGIHENDFETVRSQAHSIKSSSLNIGAAEFSSLCKKLELLPDDDKMMEEASNLFEQLKFEYDRVKSDIVNVLQALSE